MDMKFLTVGLVLFLTDYLKINVECIDLCLPSFSEFRKTHSINGVQVERYTLQDCLDYCQVNVDCLAVDFNVQDSPPCWVHTDASYLSTENLYNEDGTASQYRINRTCSKQLDITNTDCPSKWSRYNGMNSPSPSFDPVDLYTIYSCFLYCRFNTSCFGVSFDNSTWPPCHVFTKLSDLKGESLIPVPTSIVLVLDDRNNCSDTDKSYSRCSNQMFPPTSQWCPPNTNLILKSKTYGIQPFCCPGSYNPDIFPIYNPKSFAIDIGVADPVYNKVIMDCLKSPTCSLMSNNFSSAFINEPFCVGRTNVSFYVAITFQCRGQSSVVDNTNLPVVTNYQQDKAALVLGAIGTTFAIILLLLIIGLLLYYFLVFRKQSHSTTPNSRLGNFSKAPSSLGTVKGVNPVYNNDEATNWELEEVESGNETMKSNNMDD